MVRTCVLCEYMLWAPLGWIYAEITVPERDFVRGRIKRYNALVTRLFVILASLRVFFFQATDHTKQKTNNNKKGVCVCQSRASLEW